MILAGDVGGTKTLLEIGAWRDGRWQPAFSGRYVAADFSDLRGVLRQFLAECATQCRIQSPPTEACFGVAGPAFNNRAQMTNLSWFVDGNAIKTEFGIPRVQIVNDFAAAASGVEMLAENDLVVLQAGDPVDKAPRLVIGAGTGLGVASLVWTGTKYQVISGEGGHMGFSPATHEQLELCRDLLTRQGRVSTEDVVSGPGLVRIYDFVVRTTGQPASRADIVPAAIVQAAIESGDPASIRALDLFIECYGEIAGNYALATLARGGVYIAGGIAPKILNRLREGKFLAAFNAKGPYSDTLRRIPVAVVTNERLGLLGCALIASRP